MGDTGVLENINDKIEIIDTVKENNLTVHIALSLPDNLTTVFVAKVDEEKRVATQNNHSATHLLHFALRKVLGTHVEQKGSMVASDRLRFDFSHFSKVEDAQLREIETIVNQWVRANVPLCVLSDVPMREAVEMGAMALFGDKYGDKVRVVKFAGSVELCGGTHTSATGNIGYVKITSESAIAAGVRRIEAITGKNAEEYINRLFNIFDDVKEFLKSPNIMQALQKLAEENEKFRKDIEEFSSERVQRFIELIDKKIEQQNGVQIIRHASNMFPDALKQAAYRMRNFKENLVVVLGSNYEDKPNLVVAFSDDLVAKGLNAGAIVREAAKLMQGGGGGQPSLATAGGKDCGGLEDAMNRAVELVANDK
jgi:alanyl-tRNA synthetase